MTSGPGQIPALELRNVNVCYSGEAKALDSVSLHVPQGAFCVLLGRSGSGKSSLLRAAIGLVTPASGVITVNGVTVSKKTLRNVRLRMGMVHQRFNLTGRLTAAQNVMAGAAPSVSLLRCLLQWYPPEIQLKACKLIKRLGLDEAQLNQRADTLSGGQQQRIGIARALMLDPDLILADEPLASLDPHTAYSILTLLREIARERGTAVLCSLHQPELALKFADHLIALKDGQVAFEGAPHELPVGLLETVYNAEDERGTYRVTTRTTAQAEAVAVQQGN